MAGKVVTLTVRQDDDPGYVDIEGKLVAATYDGIVLQLRTGAQIYPIGLLVHARLGPRLGKLTRRKLRPIPKSQSRQHLADRHGISFDLVKHLTPEAALDLHNAIDHDNLGHNHRAVEVEEDEEE